MRTSSSFAEPIRVWRARSQSWSRDSSGFPRVVFSRVSGAHQPGGLHGLHQVVGHGGVDLRDTGDVDDRHLGPVGPDGPKELLGELAGALAVQDANDGQDQQSFAHLQHRGGQFPDGLLPLANDALAFLHEAHADRVGAVMASRRGLVTVGLGGSRQSVPEGETVKVEALQPVVPASLQVHRMST